MGTIDLDILSLCLTLGMPTNVLKTVFLDVHRYSFMKKMIYCSC